jgi:hypothetical protein
MTDDSKETAFSGFDFAARRFADRVRRGLAADLGFNPTARMGIAAENPHLKEDPAEAYFFD